MAARHRHRFGFVLPYGYDLYGGVGLAYQECREKLFVESTQNYIHIYTEKGKFTTHLTLKAIKEHLPESGFIQTHQSFIVSIDKMETLEGNQIIIGQHKIPISRYLKEQVLESIVNRNLLNKKGK